MIYRTHIAFAIAPTLVVESQIDMFDTATELLLYFSIAIGALLPDLDEEGSKLSRSFPIIPFIFGLFGVKHRGITHQLFFVLILGVIFFTILELYRADYVSKVFFYGLLYGYLLHLAGDMLTKGGINNFYFPISNVKGVLLPKAFRFYTHSKEEFMLLYFLYFVILLQVAYRFML